MKYHTIESVREMIAKNGLELIVDKLNGLILRAENAETLLRQKLKVKEPRASMVAHNTPDPS
jgi:hypothetical protein